jgi:solute carrier family 6 amino acid transporter-like protein 5/7/9/14
MSDSNGAPKTSEDYNVNLAFSGDVDVSSSYGTAITGGGGGGGGSSQPRVVNTEEGGGDDERGQWDNKCDFFLSALGYAVGLGNVWRFPYLAYKYGGGSFLLPYTFMLFFAGLPLFFLELALGQYSGAGPTRLFGRMAPIMKGLGFSMLLATFFVSIYYNVIIAWTLHYLFSGMAATLPWTDCSTFNSTWRCQDAANTTTINNVTTCEFDEFFLACRAAANGQGNETLGNNGGVVFPRPRSLDFDLSTCSAKVDLNSTAERCFSPPEDYFNSHVLGIDLGKDGHTWENMGGMQWPLVGCLFAAWTIVCLCLIKGVQSSGKVVYFTALFPFAVLIILFFRGIFLEGAIDGVKYYLTPRLDELQNGEAWQAAATQIFYSLGPAFGGLITLSSYNKFDNNCHRDAVLIAFCNCGTSVFAGIVVFSILGFMAETSGVPIEKVAEGGPGL